MISQKLFFVNEHVTAILQTNTSDYRIGGMPYQIVNEIIQPITYISKALQGTCTVQWVCVKKNATRSFALSRLVDDNRSSHVKHNMNKKKRNTYIN